MAEKEGTIARLEGELYEALKQVAHESLSPPKTTTITPPQSPTTSQFKKVNYSQLTITKHNQ